MLSECWIFSKHVTVFMNKWIQFECQKIFVSCHCVVMIITSCFKQPEIQNAWVSNAKSNNMTVHSIFKWLLNFLCNVCHLALITFVGWLSHHNTTNKLQIVQYLISLIVRKLYNRSCSQCYLVSVRIR